MNVEELYRRHGHLVLRRARTLLGNEHDAEEVLQEVFMSFLGGAGFDGRSSPTTFLFAATTNRCLNRLRNHRRREALLDVHVKPTAAQRTEPSRGDVLAIVRNLARQLPERLVVVAVYAYVDEFTHEQIGELLGLSRRRVGQLLEEFKRAAQALTEHAA